jgi:hypothetical protein
MNIQDVRCSAPGLSLRLQLLDGESASEVYLKYYLYRLHPRYCARIFFVFRYD